MQLRPLSAVSLLMWFVATLLVLPAAAALGQTETATATEPAATETETATATEQATEEAAARIFGTIRNQDGTLQDVEIVVSRGGEVVGEATTGEDGQWEVQLPGPGNYEVELVEESLPEGVSLREDATNPLTIRVQTGGSRPALFLIGERADVGTAAWKQLAQLAVNGLKIGLIIAITSVGLSLIFGTTGLINFAHGELVSMGAIVAFYLSVQGPDLGLIIAALIAIVIMGGVGAVLEKGLFKPLRDRKVGLFQMLVITIGLSLLLQNILLLWFGGGFQPYDEYIGQQSLTFGPVRIVPRELWIMIIAGLILVGIAMMLQRTKIGKAMRAVADNRDLAESSGIDVERVILVVWVLGVALAAVGGIMTGLMFQVDFRMGFRLLLLMFAGIILGGLGTAYGAIVGGIVVGLATEISTYWFRAELKNAWALAVLIIVLLFRPQGILGKKERVG